jgi:uncharacterized RDD family membrane protein YckC
LTFSADFPKIVKKSKGVEMIQRHKARPDQAGFFRRFLAFAIDYLIIMLIALIIFFVFSEIAAARRGEKGDFSRMLTAIKKGESVVIGFNKTDPPSEMETPSRQDKKTYFIGGESFKLIFEFLIGYTYYVLFFRFGGRPPGKRLLRLQVVDLEGHPRLGWYQSLERTHGYAASALLAFLGFLQVLWDHKGLAMHDRLAGTTVIRLKKDP